jgi:hypothetical protein
MVEFAMVKMPRMPDGWLDGDWSGDDAFRREGGDFTGDEGFTRSVEQGAAPVNPDSITGILAQAASRPMRGTALSLVMEPHEIAEAAIP